MRLAWVTMGRVWVGVEMGISSRNSPVEALASDGMGQQHLRLWRRRWRAKSADGSRVGVDAPAPRLGVGSRGVEALSHRCVRLGLLDLTEAAMYVEVNSDISSMRPPWPPRSHRGSPVRGKQ